MSARQVTHTGKDRDGDITALCNPTSWGRRAKRDAISDIELGIHEYFVNRGGRISRVVVKHGVKGKYLSTEPDSTPLNNLDNLPNC